MNLIILPETCSAKQSLYWDMSARTERPVVNQLLNLFLPQSFAPYENGQGFWYRFLTYFCVILPSFLPIFPVVVCCAIFVKIVLRSKRKVRACKLRLKGATSSSTFTLTKLRVGLGERSGVELSSAEPGAPRKEVSPDHGARVGTADLAHQATTTMYIVTALYIVFNVPFWSFTLAILFFQADHITWLKNNAMYIHIFLYRTSVLMNAASNPIVYLTRIRALKRQFVMPKQLFGVGYLKFSLMAQILNRRSSKDTFSS